MIINICSVASLISKGHCDYNTQYTIDKRNQRIFCENVNFQYSKQHYNMYNCKLVNVNLDYVNTNFPTKYDKNNFPNLSVDEVTKLIKFIISTFNTNISIREISAHAFKIIRS
jgi:hypothetical protein